MSAKQEKIAKGLAIVIKEALALEDLRGTDCVIKALRYLDNQGLVLKVDDGKTPRFQERLTSEANWRNLKKEGWTKTERLI